MYDATAKRLLVCFGFSPQSPPPINTGETSAGIMQGAGPTGNIREAGCGAALPKNAAETTVEIKR